MSAVTLWIQYGSGQPFKVDGTDSQDVSDIIEMVKTKLALTVRLDTLNLLVMDGNGFKGHPQRPGTLISQILRSYPWAGKNDRHPLLIRMTNQPQTNATFQPGWNYDFSHINQILYSELNTVNWLTMAFIADCLLDFELFPFYSATSLLIALKVSVYIILYHNERLEQYHFTCSSDNLSRGRYWTLLSSSLAHGDINHLLCNVFALAVGGPHLESILGFKYSVVFFCLSSVLSCIASERFHGLPSIGSSGIIYAIEGFFIRGVDLESLPYYILEQVLFYFATEGNVDHAAHIGGFLFGYMAHDVWFHRSWRFGN